MCLALPMRLIKIDGDTGFAEAVGIEQKIGLHLLPNIQVNDWVIVHAGFAIQKMDEVYAKQAIALFEEMRNLS